MEAQASVVARARAPIPPRAWHVLDEAAVMVTLSSARSGLSQDVAARRLEQHGLNELRQSRGFDRSPYSWLSSRV